MNKIGDLRDKITEIESDRLGEISKVLNEIEEEYKSLERRYNEVEKQCIDYETSTQLGLGYELLQYGKILDVLYDSFDNGKRLEELLKDINDLYDLELFENSGYVLEDFENKIMKELERRNYDFNITLMDLTTYVENTLIMDSILEKVKNVK